MEFVIRTVGHSNRSVEDFLAILAAHRVDAVVDVRSVPWSRRWPWFRKRELAAALHERGVDYVHEGRALGGRATDGGAAAGFEAAIGRVCERARRARVAIMCAEADPARCHRARLLAPAFLARGARVTHLLGPQTEEDHTVTARRLPPPAPVVRDLFQ